jgi:hypothetical protein
MFQGLWVIVPINHEMKHQKESSYRFLGMSWDIMTHYEIKRVIKGYYGIFFIFQMFVVLDLQKLHTLLKLTAQVPWSYTNCHITLKWSNQISNHL